MSGGADVLATTNAAQASRAHQPRHAPGAYVHALLDELGVHAWASVGITPAPVDLMNP